MDPSERKLLLAHARAEADPLTTSDRRKAEIKREHEARRQKIKSRRSRR